MGLVVFTDLDGTLLDHQAYDYTPARPALDALAQRGVPLVLTSSKTRAEMIVLWHELGLDHPFIAENGGGVYAPFGHALAQGSEWSKAGDGWLVRRLGMPIEEVRRRFLVFKDRFGAKGFGDLTDREVAGFTGLSLEKAALAGKREFNEPLILPEPEKNEAGFVRAAQEQGLSVTRGGRFFHLLGGGDKGRAVSLVSSLYREKDKNLKTMALGDAPNDLAMFKAVDHPVLVARPDLSHAPLELPNLKRENLPGPEGFNHAVNTFLTEKQDA
ncbi:HAD-IIB family hydrolase [Dethiosulfatarculus sandiegensis]|uniref:Mannosyl-3-phosphoglycerate phosphatase n=1 Tax=Dethiosulfatarculus sandiegensis TaxID=1429043 RepID=A0A0D2IY14_9BACT|nr:HAD-IIB family hydrolase [Dethiosulfatarculus sandiegensis]KIX10919.1 mannosyl-3-phosphoglycerate phosphatase [Dethiosulfatarculus sandiegensis]